MKKTTLAIALLFCVYNSVFSQNYKKLFYKNTTIETTEATIEIDDAVSTEKETKFKIRITNKTNSYILYKPEESRFLIDGKELQPKKGNWELVSPNDYGTLVVNLPGQGYTSLKNYSYRMDGIYTITIKDSGISVPDFKLPPSQNDFNAGTFAVTLDDLNKKTDKTSVKFKCTYNGSKVGIVFPSKIAVKMPDGNEYANAKSSGKSKPIIFNRGETESFGAMWEKMQGGKSMDMQFVDMIIKWHSTFMEVTPVKVQSETLNLEFDEATSNEKGR